jgi:hypothetical protein
MCVQGQEKRKSKTGGWMLGELKRVVDVTVVLGRGIGNVNAGRKAGGKDAVGAQLEWRTGVWSRTLQVWKMLGVLQSQGA